MKPLEATPKVTYCRWGRPLAAFAHILTLPKWYLATFKLITNRWAWELVPSLCNKRFWASSSRKVGTRAKKQWRGRGRGKKEPLARKPHDFEKLRSPTNAASDWCGAGGVDYLALETSIKPGMLCLRAPQIWSYLICGRRLQLLWTDLSRVCAKVYEISKVYWEI